MGYELLFEISQKSKLFSDKRHVWFGVGNLSVHDNNYTAMSIYEEVEIEDMVFNEADLSYTYPCPCGDTFRITLEELHDGEDVAKCPSCTLRILVIYDECDLPPLPDDFDDDEKESEETDLIDKFATVQVSG